MNALVSHFRETLKYVARFSKQTFVVAIDGRAIEDNDILSLAGDVSLLRGVGVRLVLAVGFSDRADFRERRRTRYARLQALAGQLCQSVDGTSQIPSVPGDKLADSEPVRFTVQVNERDAGTELISLEVNEILDRGLVPIVVAKPAAGREEWFGILAKVVAALCRGVRADKLVYLACVDGIYRKDKSLIREAGLDEIRKLAAAGVITGQFSEFVAMAGQVIEAGVTRVHLISGKINGGLLREMLTRDGVGTMIHSDFYQQTRLAGKADICGILDVLNAHAERGDMRRYTEDAIISHLDNYHVTVRDGEVVACGCLRCFPEEKKALISSFAADPSCLSRGEDPMLARLLAEARGRGMEQAALVGLRTGLWRLGREWRVGTAGDLPAELRGSEASSVGTILVRHIGS